MHADYRYVAYLKENNAKGIDEIYAKYADKIKGYIIKNSGNEADAADILQEALIDIYHLSYNPSFELTCPFEAFLFTVCKRKWLNILKKRKRTPVTSSLDDVYTIKEEDLATSEAYVQKIEEENTIMQLLETMGDRCKSIIKACMERGAQDAVAEKLGLTYAYLRKKKSECMAALRKLAMNHPLFSCNTH